MNKILKQGFVFYVHGIIIITAVNFFLKLWTPEQYDLDMIGLMFYSIIGSALMMIPLSLMYMGVTGLYNNIKKQEE